MSIGGDAAVAEMGNRRSSRGLREFIAKRIRREGARAKKRTIRMRDVAAGVGRSMGILGFGVLGVGYGLESFFGFDSL